jgi:alpha-amylase
MPRKTMNLFSKYSNKLNNELKGYSVLNYMSSHDDGAPFDAKRTIKTRNGTKLFSPGFSRILW